MSGPVEALIYLKVRETLCACSWIPLLRASSLLVALGAFWGLPGGFPGPSGGKMKGCPKPSISVQKNRIFHCGYGHLLLVGLLKSFEAFLVVLGVSRGPVRTFGVSGAVEALLI